MLSPGKLILFLSFFIPSFASALEVGISKVDITPYEFERMKPGQRGAPYYIRGHKYFDTGVDGLFDIDEPGAFGPDNKPGIANHDDDGNGIIDDKSEYLSKMSDDVKDASGDNFHWKYNRKGTEGNKRFEFMVMGGFNPFYNVPFAQARVADGIHDQIWSRALTFKNDNKTIVMISTDLPGLNMKYINPVKRKIEEVYGIPLKNIVITSTHNHGAPDGSGFWTTRVKKHNKKMFTHNLRAKIFESAKQAIENMQPARMKTITTDHIACYNPKTRKWKRPQDCKIEQGGDRPAIQRDGRDPQVLNYEIVASHFTHVNTGETIATFVNWHNHPEAAHSANMLITSDFPHYIREYLEERLGGTSIYFSGTVGCQIGNTHYVPKWSEEGEPLYDGVDSDGNPTRAEVGEADKWTRLRSIGYEIGSEVLKSFQSETKQLESVEISADRQVLDVAPVNILHLLVSGSMWRFDVEKEDRMKRYWPRCLPPRGCVRTDVQKFRIGNLSFLTAPGEIDPSYWLGREESVYDYGKKGKKKYRAMKGAKEFLDTEHKAVFGQANGYLSYMIHRHDNHGALKFSHPNHYEEFVTVNKHFGDDLGNLWMWMLESDYRYSKRKIYPRPQL